jgi:hypothetical protein
MSYNDSSWQILDETDTFIFKFLVYQPLVIIALGMLGNVPLFLILRFHREFKASSTMVYLSLVAVTDSLSLFGWNLEHYLNYSLNTSSLLINKPLCKIALFNQFFSSETGALLLSLSSFDRFLHISSLPGSLLNKLPFRTIKSAYAWSFGVILLMFLLNSHLFLFSCGNLLDSEFFLQLDANFTKKEALKRKINYQFGNNFIRPSTWQRFHLIVYVFIPFFIMIVSNCLIVHKLTLLNKSRIYQLTWRQTRKKFANTISLLMVTCLFLLMTLPSSLVHSIFSNLDATFVFACDIFSYTSNLSLFLVCFLTNSNFRRVFISVVKK